MIHPSEMQLGWAYPRRQDHIGKLIAAQSEFKHKLRFQHEVQALDVYKIPIDLPKYRLANGRTLAAQQEFLAEHPELGQDFFHRDAELADAQEAQHGILTQMLKSSSTKTDLLRFFSEHQQEQPLILSRDGFVVNGNRRLCAFRNLYYGDKSRYGHFAHLDAVILPACDERDIDELEASLQIQPDIKQDYTWTAQALMLRVRQERYGYSDKDLAVLFEMDVKEVRNMLDLLALADAYLEERRKPHHYGDVDKAEYAFQTLQKERLRLYTEPDKEFLTQLTFCMIDSDEVTGRLYGRIPKVRQYIKPIEQELGNRLDVTPVDTESDNSDYSIFGNSTAETSGGASWQLIPALKDRANINTIIEVLETVIEEEDSKVNQRKRSNAVLNFVSKANRHLIEAVGAISPESSTAGVSNQLDSIEASLTKLRDWLAANDNDRSDPA